VIRRLALVTDAWHPQINGVVTTLSRLVAHLKHAGIDVLVVTSDEGATISLPLYGDLRVSREPWRAVARIERFAPDAVHVATEGPLGMWTRVWLGRMRLAFTTSFHTRFPEYVSARLPVPVEWGYHVERWFHRLATRTMVGTRSLMLELAERQIGRCLVHWPRGVDGTLFNPVRRDAAVYAGLPKPIWLYVGRVAVEKDLGSFLSLRLRGTKVVVGDGPDRAALVQRYPDTIWRGWRQGEELAAHFASADCFVFPSRTETFGNVLLEALASGLPVAARPSPGPLDLIETGINGALAESLSEACHGAIACSREQARESAMRYSWQASHDLFQRYLVPLMSTEGSA
jgi:glycosyltransferase involved in cell wall biosynthesis